MQYCFIIQNRKEKYTSLECSIVNNKGPFTNYVSGSGEVSHNIIYDNRGGGVGDIYNELFNFISISILNFFLLTNYLSLI